MKTASKLVSLLTIAVLLLGVMGMVCMPATTQTTSLAAEGGTQLNGLIITLPLCITPDKCTVQPNVAWNS